VPTVEVPEIQATSPTLAETMRACLLRAGLSRAAGTSNFVLGNPKAWLGTAYHEVLEKIAAVNLEEQPLENAVERLWNRAIAALETRAGAHVLDRRFGSPTKWPGYYVARASASLRAQELVRGATPVASATKQGTDTGPPGVIREQEFSGFRGRLHGRPDVVRNSEVIDYKSGTVLEHDAATQTDVVRASYVRQLRIYGYLIRQTLGWWPRRGVLLPLGGAGVEVALDPYECEQEANEAMILLESYDEKLRNAAEPEDVASPSATVCRWCPYKLICPSFWRTSSPAWSGHLDGAAVEGALVGDPGVIHGGAARAIALNVEAGSEAHRRVQIAPLNPDTHASVSVLAAGDRVRLVGLRTRADGVLVPTQRTILAPVIGLPAVAFARTKQ
jgi:hypothetical protein